VRRLRSRWTVVALVPAFFLAGFGIVAALAGGSDDPSPAAAQEQTEGSGGAGGTATASTESAPTTTAPVPSTTAPPATTSPTTTSANGGGNGNGNGGGNRPPAPPPGTIQVDYGQWDGVFEIADPVIVPDFGMASVTGELRYFGGVDCGQVHRVVVRGWFYNAKGQFVGPALWESAYATGEGGEVSGREGLPFEAYGNVSELPESAVLRFVKVEC
jgi:hypothetical protein